MMGYAAQRRLRIMQVTLIAYILQPPRIFRSQREKDAKPLQCSRFLGTIFPKILRIKDGDFKYFLIPDASYRCLCIID